MQQTEIEEELAIDCFSHNSHYKSIEKSEFMYNANVSEKVKTLSRKLETANDDKVFFMLVTQFYKDYGVGMFGLNKAFRLRENGSKDVEIIHINNMDKVMLNDLIGYEILWKKNFPWRTGLA